MFCPKCGRALPDEATFCSACGEPMAARASESAASSNATQSSSNGVPSFLEGALAGNNASVLRIVAVVAAGIAIIFSLMPWLETSPILQGVGAVGSAVGQLGSALTGQNYNIADFDASYAPYGFLGLSNDLKDYLGSRGNSYSLVLFLFFLFWLASVVDTVIGAILMFSSRDVVKNKAVKFLAGRKAADAIEKGKMHAAFSIGCALLAVVAFAWVVYYGALAHDSIATGTPINAILCGVVSIVAALLAVYSGKER